MTELAGRPPGGAVAEVAELIRAERAVEGEGFVVRRPFPTASRSQIDPFLLFDHLGPVTNAPGAGAGTPWHPHRGFETVTYLLEGEVDISTPWVIGDCSVRATPSG